MAVVQKKTKYEFDGHDYPYTLIANDELADRLRNSSFSDVTITDIVDKQGFIDALANYVGDITDIAIPCTSYAEVNYPTTFEKFKKFFPNGYSVLATTPNTKYEDYFKFAGLDCDGIGDNENFIILANTSDYTSSTIIGNNPKGLSSVSFQTRLLSNWIILYIPIFKESELADNTIHSVNNQCWLQIRIISVYRDGKLVSYTLNLTRHPNSNTQYFNIFVNQTIPDAPPQPSDDPYQQGGYSGTGGGQGNYDTTSDPIALPNLPTSYAPNCRLFTAFNPTTGELAGFAHNLWSASYTSFDELFQKLFGGDAFNAIIGLHMLPVQPDVDTDPVSIKLGNWDSGSTAHRINNQYKEVDFGSVTLNEFWGNCIDYDPYTKIQLALPYIGIVDVGTDDVMGAVNHLVYHIDVLSGAVCAMLHCTKGNLASVLYQWSGSCAVSLPISGVNYNNIITTSVTTGIASYAIAGKAMGGMMALGGGALSAGVVSGAVTAGAAATIYGAMKGKVQKSGGFGSNAGALGVMTPYFIITRPVQSVPSSWQADKGYPANISAQLGSVIGYTEVSEINLQCSGTENEKKEIIELLKTGVIF